MSIPTPRDAAQAIRSNVEDVRERAYHAGRNGSDEYLDSTASIMPYPPVPARVGPAYTPTQQMTRIVGIPLAIGAGITALVTIGGAIAGVIWALNW